MTSLEYRLNYSNQDTVFEAHNDRFDFGLDPSKQNNDSGAGALSYFDKVSNS